MLPGIDDLAIDCPAGAVTVTYEPSAVTEDEIVAALQEIGYPPAQR